MGSKDIENFKILEAVYSNRPSTGLKGWTTEKVSTLPCVYSWQLLFLIILSARTTDDQVNRLAKSLFTQFSSLDLFVHASTQEIESCISTIGLFRSKAGYLKRSAEMLEKEHNGIPPVELQKLVRLPGVGRKTANVYLAVMWEEWRKVVSYMGPACRQTGNENLNEDELNVNEDCPSPNKYSYSTTRQLKRSPYKPQGIAVDTHVARVSQRLGLTQKKTPTEIEKELMQTIPRTLWFKVNKTLFWHGREICLSRNPKCESCPIEATCPWSS